jgi:hypothetical protein
MVMSGGFDLRQATHSALYLEFCKESRIDPNFVNPEMDITSSRFREWLELRSSPEAKASPSPKTKEHNVSNDLTRLIPGWHQKVKIGQIRMKTLLRIYLSKWFYEGLKWYEADLLEELALRLNIVFPEEISRDDFYLKVGFRLMEKIYHEDDLSSFDMMGWKLFPYIESLCPLLYTLEEYKAIWKLRSFQSIRDFLFTTADYESVGKLNLKKRRIRGYRDGKSSPRDLTKTALPRKMDVIFYEDKFLDRWNALQDEIEAMSSLP